MALQRSYNVIFSHFYTAKINVEEYNSLVTSCKAILVEKDKTGFNSLSKIAFDGLILVNFFCDFRSTCYNLIKKLHLKI